MSDSSPSSSYSDVPSPVVSKGPKRKAESAQESSLGESTEQVIDRNVALSSIEPSESRAASRSFFALGW